LSVGGSALHSQREVGRSDVGGGAHLPVFFWSGFESNSDINGIIKAKTQMHVSIAKKPC